MNGFLIDTHILLWALFEPDKLSGKARQAIADTDNTLYVSAISFWEISLKFALGKLELEGCDPEQLVGYAGEMGALVLQLSGEEAASFHRLPKLSHKDPFDRMLIRQAIIRDLTLISRDSAFAEYKKHGLEVLW